MHIYCMCRNFCAMMSRVLCLFTLIVAGSNVLAGIDDLDKEALEPCMEMFKEENSKNACCKGMEEMVGKAEKCQKNKGEWTCEDSKCIMNNAVEEDGKISENKFSDMLESKKNDKPEYKDTIEGIQKQCLGGKYENYGMDDVCPATKFLVCLYLQILTTCPEWNEGDTCKKMSENAQKCKPILDLISA